MIQNPRPEENTHEKCFQTLYAAMKKDAITQTPMLDAKLLAEHICSCAFLHQSKRGTGEQKALALVLERYRQHEPVSRILGVRHFWEGVFHITPETFDPRPETETLLEVALPLFPKNKPLTLLDWGTGSGCLLVSLLGYYRSAFGIGTEQNFHASVVAQKNARHQDVAHRASLLQTRDTRSLRSGCLDLFVSNPPYIASGMLALLPRAVRNFDPREALDGGDDGVCAYRVIIPEARRLLKKGGFLVLEIGSEQSDKVCSLLEENAFERSTLHKDLGDHPRCVMAQRG